MGANAYEKRAAHCNNKSFLPIFRLPSNERWRMGNKKRKRDEKSGKMRINFYELSYDRKNRVFNSRRCCFCFDFFNFFFIFFVLLYLHRTKKSTNCLVMRTTRNCCLFNGIWWCINMANGKSKYSNFLSLFGFGAGTQSTW